MEAHEKTNWNRSKWLQLAVSQAKRGALEPLARFYGSGAWIRFLPWGGLQFNEKESSISLP